MSTETPKNAAPCPYCGGSVTTGGRGLGRTFCGPEDKGEGRCQQRYTAMQKSRGAVLAPFVQAWLMTRHAEPGSEEAEICKYARRELTEIGGIFNAEDRRDGRPPAAEYVLGRMKSAMTYTDLRRKPDVKDAPVRRA